MTIKTGDAVWVCWGDRKVEGRIVLASPNQQSLFVEFDAAMRVKDGLLAGAAALSMNEDGTYFPLHDSDVKIVIKQREDLY